MADVPGIAGYAEEAPRLFERYEKRAFADMHRPILGLFPPAPALVLDIGAGTGRDAAGFAKRGDNVVAVEPVAPLREGARTRHPEKNIAWIDDGLPELVVVAGLDQKFDLVMMTAVLMHLDAPTRARSLENTVPLIKPGGLLAMTLRHGPVPAGRVMFDISADEIRALCAPLGLSPVFEAETNSNEQAGVSWTRLALRKDRIAD